MTDRPLQQLDQLPGRHSLHRALELGEDRPRRLRPRRALRVRDEPAGAQRAVDLGLQRRQPAVGASGDQAHLPLQVEVATRRGGDHRPQLVDGQAVDQSLDREHG
jgi:hypothetical protein